MAANDRFRETIAALRVARESRDGYPSEFMPELLALVGPICDELELPERERDEVMQVALNHDIGMLGVSTDVLLARRSLTPAERAEVEQSPVIAARLFEEVPGMERVARAIRHVREHWDGSGYPDRLKGEEIPLASRIVFVASAYLAMSVPRPHRAAMHPRAVCDELEHGAGSHFDPRIVDVLLGLIRPLLLDPPPRA